MIPLAILYKKNVEIGEYNFIIPSFICNDGKHGQSWTHYYRSSESTNINENKIPTNKTIDHMSESSQVPRLFFKALFYGVQEKSDLLLKNVVQVMLYLDW